MSGLHFTPGRKGKLSKLLRNLYYCQTKQQEPPFKGKGFSYTFENDLFVITFKTSGIIEFNEFVTKKYAVQKAEEWLSEKVTLEHYNLIKDDLFFSMPFTLRYFDEKSFCKMSIKKLFFPFSFIYF